MTNPNLSKAFKSFLGYLEGTQKSAHTIKNYRLDLQAFFEFAEKSLARRTSKPLGLEDLTPQILAKFAQHLEAQGFKPNSRRRMIFTAQAFLNYQTKRKKLPETRIWKTPTPTKVERTPKVLSFEEFARRLKLEKKISGLTEFDLRNRVMAQVFFETGCLVSELSSLKFDDLVFITPQTPGLKFYSKDGSHRTVPISKRLYHEIKKLLGLKSYATDWIFVGFDRVGPRLAANAPISHRGVELLIRSLIGVPPRILRHSAAVQWIQSGATRQQVQERLGLKTSYSIKFYEPWFKGI